MDQRSYDYWHKMYYLKKAHEKLQLFCATYMTKYKSRTTILS
jgi:hypothetical protein